MGVWTKALLAATISAAAVGVVTMAPAMATAQAPAAQTVDDFRLADQEFLARHLYKMGDAKAVVLFTYASGDKQVRADAPALMALKQGYAANGVEFMALASKLGESRDKVIPDAKAAGLAVPILFDYNQLVGEQLGVTRAAEAIVINPKTWTVAYRGPVDGAKAALDGLVAGQKVALPFRQAKGGAIPFPERAKAKSHANISYVNDVAPIIQQKCAGCHQPGGIGPMQLTNYEQVKGFSPMIREVIRTQRMPPFLADPTVGHFKDDERLSAQQIKTLVHWIEAGSPRGAGEDPLAKIKFQAPEWPLGKPDVIVEIPPAKIPATGVMEYQRPAVPSVMTEGRWMKASTFKVTDRQAVHHILSGVVEAKTKDGDTASESSWGASLGGYGPGRGSNINPPDLGVWIPPSGGVAFQNHYTPYGKESVEKTQMGIYFYPKGQEPKYVLRTFLIADFSIVIPPGEEWHREMAYVTFPKEAVLYGITPHAHKRGGSTSLSIRYPDGKEEMLLAMPRYDFNWQYEYFLKEPLKIPAGSKVIARYTFDNSTRNHGNPDHTKQVVWGEQSWEEMLATYLHYRWTDETVANQKPENDKMLQASLFMGAFDDNLDSKIQAAELKGTQGENLKKFLPMVDKNKDSAIDQTELAEAQKLMPRRRPAATPTPGAPAAAPAAAAAGSGGR
ncbi:redoxin domain-containing protein [Phenylobacterium sp.]|uniref:monooxygenase n=1 Tax=Phenylobacterium sp. TaxID=1871053 RepID=UPI002F93ACE2